MLSEDKKIIEKSEPLIPVQKQDETDEEIKDIVIHDMPERFRLFNQADKEKSKYGMVLFLVVGVFMALLASIAVYYFSSKTKTITPSVSSSKNVVSEIPIEETKIAPSSRELYLFYNSEFLALTDLIGYENFLVKNASQERIGEWQAQKEKIDILPETAKTNLLIALKKGILSQNDMKEVQENLNGNESVLNIVMANNQKASVRMVMENGTWKLDKEYWPDAGSSNGLPFLVDNIATEAIASSTDVSDGLATSTPANASSTEIQATTTQPAVTGLQTQYILGADVDSDSLSDKEEVILNTDSTKFDSDGDGYNDGDEVIGLYDPASSGKLLDNKNINTYKNLAKNYSVLYPSVWAVEKVDGDNSLIFMSTDGQFFQVVVQSNPRGQTIEDWYKEQFNPVAININNLITGSDWSGIKSDDGLNVYLTDNSLKNIYVLSYSPGANKTIDYSRLFAIFVKTFALSK